MSNLHPWVFEFRQQFFPERFIFFLSVKMPRSVQSFEFLEGLESFFFLSETESDLYLSNLRIRISHTHTHTHREWSVSSSAPLVGGSARVSRCGGRKQPGGKTMRLLEADRDPPGIAMETADMDLDPAGVKFPDKVVYGATNIWVFQLVI